VDTRGCKIVDMNPFDESVLKFLKKDVKPYQCYKPVITLDKQVKEICVNHYLFAIVKEPNSKYQ